MTDQEIQDTLTAALSGLDVVTPETANDLSGTGGVLASTKTRVHAAMTAIGFRLASHTGTPLWVRTATVDALVTAHDEDDEVSLATANAAVSASAPREPEHYLKTRALYGAAGFDFRQGNPPSWIKR